MRDIMILAAAVVALQVTCSRAEAASVTEISVHRAHQGRTGALRAEAAHIRAHASHIRPHVVRAVAETAGAPPLPTYQVPPPAIDTSVGEPISLAYHAPPEPPTLSEQESAAGQMAIAKGDKTFLMVDKALGKIILFENGLPVFGGPALTGESMADRLPEHELTEKFDDLNAPNTKITPAGRFTIQRGYEKDVGGELFDVHEIRGKDWGIAIHQVYLGIPSEHRAARIKSPSAEDKHITFGCINGTPEASRSLLRELPEKSATPLYILPEDASQTAAYFA